MKIKEITDKTFWQNSLKEFEDANIYQTWNFAKLAQNEKIVRHIAIIENSDIVGLVQVRIRTLPLLKRGIAYIFNGPLWQKKNQKNKIEVLYGIFRILLDEFTVNQKLLLRIRPFIYTDENSLIDLNLIPGFKLNEKKQPYKTLLLYLNKSEDELRAGLKGRWRRFLNKAERNGLEIIEGNDPELYQDFLRVYNQMMARKKFKEYVNPIRMGEMNNELDEELKLKIFLAYKDGAPIASLVGSALGKTGIGLLGGINELGMKLYGSYLLQWEMIKWIRQSGCQRYDLGGINLDDNPDVYHFKSGITDHEVLGMGIYETCNGGLSKRIVNLGEFIKR